MTSAQDEQDWARAQTVLEQLPPEAAEHRARRLRVQRRLAVSSVVMTVTAVVTLVLVVVVDRGSLGGDIAPAGWHLAVGSALQAVGLVGMLTAYAVHAGAVRHTRGWGRPMHWLTRQEQKGLLRQVRGKDPLVPEQLPLARHAACTLLVRRPPAAAPSALLLVVVGQYATAPDLVRFLLAVAMAVAAAAAEVQVRRDDRRVQRFLIEHPLENAP